MSLNPNPLVSISHRAHIRAVVDLVLRCHRKRAKGNGRTVVAIAGPPASGKTTLAHAVVQQLNTIDDARAPVSTAALLPMDGYHLDNDDLDAMGLRSRKGAVDTFDQQGYCADLAAVKKANNRISLPSFDRENDRVIKDAIHILPETQIVVAEGNYLLLDQAPWRAAAANYNASVFVKAPIEVLKKRLIQRWLDHGLSEDTARAKVLNNDLPNAEFVLENSQPADLVIEHPADVPLDAPSKITLD